jgi:hypothetical protein
MLRLPHPERLPRSGSVPVLYNPDSIFTPPRPSSPTPISTSWRLRWWQWRHYLKTWSLSDVFHCQSKQKSCSTQSSRFSDTLFHDTYRCKNSHSYQQSSILTHQRVKKRPEATFSFPSSLGVQLGLCFFLFLYIALLPAFLLMNHITEPGYLSTTLVTGSSSAFSEDDGDSSLWLPPWNSISDVYVTDEEMNFPLAYSIVMYTDVKQMMMLLRAIYRKHNSYCIHLDAGSDLEMQLQMKRLIKHLPNVFLAENPVRVIHSTFTVLEADLICMKQLLRKSRKWRYFINLTGQEYPRKTNLELVRILRSMNSSNLMSKEVLLPDRVWKRYWRQPPYGIQLVKGSVHIIASREFVKYCTFDPHAVALRQYLKDTKVPDESFFSTLNHDPKLRVPGGYSGEEFSGVKYPFVNRLKVWWNDWHEFPCHGVYIRLICIFGDENYYDLIDEENPSLFINKFIVSINGNLLKRIDKWFHERQKHVYANANSINIDFYRDNMPQVSQHY